MSPHRLTWADLEAQARHELQWRAQERAQAGADLALYVVAAIALAVVLWVA